jgi:diguanylate cyclase (GGDEF)-like protein
MNLTLEAGSSSDWIPIESQSLVKDSSASPDQMPKNELKRALEPMCALDPLLLIPRIEYIDDVHAYVLSQPKAYCVVILDLKNFHIINDLYSYDTGDRVIESFIAGFRQRLPSGSVSLRFRHGEEFLFFVPEPLREADSLFQSFREECETTPGFTVGDHTFFISYRFAVLDLTRGEEVRALLARAERALRAVKGQGSPRP